MHEKKKFVKNISFIYFSWNYCKCEYLKKDGEVYYEMPYLEIKSKVKGADAKTLENVGEDNMEIAGFFGKDSKNT